MSTEQEDLDQIKDAAALWVAEAEEGLSPARQREFEQWQRLDPRHAAAVREFQWGCSVLGKVPHLREELQPVIPFPSAHQRPSEESHRAGRPWRRLLGACAAAVVLGATAWWAWPVSTDAPVRYACDAGCYQRVTLKDGSLLELNESSVVLVTLKPQVRQITLEAGEAHFTVARDAARPFVVAAKGVAVRAIGTAFRVRIEPSSVDVLVTEGKVAIVEAEISDSTQSSTADGRFVEKGHLVDVAAGEQTRIVTSSGRGSPASGQKPTVEKATSEKIRRTLDWQEKKLFFAEVPLREVVAQFNRRNRLQLVVDDPQLASRPVGGTFAADNVEGFIRLLESSGTITTDRRGEFEIVLRPRQRAPR
jgi:transmembrane sensor